MNTILLVGGELCERTARLLDPARWTCIGLRRRRVVPDRENPISWYQADVRSPQSLALLDDDLFSRITHILYAPSPDSRTALHYAQTYSLGFRRMLSTLPARCVRNLQRCVLVSSSVVWGPSEDWVDESTPVQHTGFRAEALLDAEAALERFLPPGTGIALRLSGLYGPGRLRLLQGLQAGTIQAPAGPGHWANRIHIDDAAGACAHLLTLSDPQPLYIGTDDRPLPTAELYNALTRMMKVALPALRPLAPSGKRLSNARLRASGWRPTWPTALQWYAENVEVAFSGPVSGANDLR